MSIFCLGNCWIYDGIMMRWFDYLMLISCNLSLIVCGCSIFLLSGLAVSNGFLNLLMVNLFLFLRDRLSMIRYKPQIRIPNLSTHRPIDYFHKLFVVVIWLLAVKVNGSAKGQKLKAKGYIGCWLLAIGRKVKKYRLNSKGHNGCWNLVIGCKC